MESNVERREEGPFEGAEGGMDRVFEFEEEVVKCVIEAISTVFPPPVRSPSYQSLHSSFSSKTNT